MRLTKDCCSAQRHLAITVPARAETAVKIGVLNDRSGIYADLERRGLGDRRQDGG